MKKSGASGSRALLKSSSVKKSSKIPKKFTNGDRSPLAARIKIERERRNWTHTELAKRMNGPIATVYLIENGERLNPGYQTVAAIARAFEISIEELIGAEAPPGTTAGEPPYVAEIRRELRDLHRTTTDAHTSLSQSLRALAEALAQSIGAQDLVLPTPLHDGASRSAKPVPALDGQRKRH